MNLLSIETATDRCCVTLYRSEEKNITYTERITSSHTKLLASFVDTIVQENSFLIKTLDHIILSIGPGAYSGLRAGSSFSKGLAYAIGKNIITVNTIDAMNLLVNDDGEYYIALYSHQDYVYYQKFCNGKPIEGQHCGQILNLEKHKFYGYGLEKFSDINSSEVRPSSLNLINYILKNRKLIVKQNIAQITPIYLTKE